MTWWRSRAKYETFDILQDEEVRQNLKTFSNWPTYPQVYVKGQLIGGLDIIKVSMICLLGMPGTVRRWEERARFVKAFCVHYPTCFPFQEMKETGELESALSVS